MASIERRSETTYRITVSCGYNANGKKLFKKKTISVEPTLTEKQREKKLTELAVLFEREVQNGTYLDGEKITLGEFAEIWLRDYAEKNLAPSTLNPYKLRINKRIVPTLGHIKLAKLQPHHLMEFYNNLEDDGIRLDSLYVATDILKDLLSKENKVKLSEKTGVYRKTFTRLCDGKGIYYNIAEMLSNFYKLPIEELFEHGGNDKKLSSKTIRHHHTLISAILSTAVSWNIINSNPAERVKLKKQNKSNNRVDNYYDNNQLLNLFICLEKEPIKYTTIVYLTIDTGLRLSEVAGLEWSAINFEGNYLVVSKQRQYVSHYGIIEKNPKSFSGLREITISESVIKILKKYQRYQVENRLQMGSLWHESNNIFTHEDGKPIFPNRPSIWFNEFIKRNNLPEITFHGLRHTNASLLIAGGIDIVTLTGRLGHADKNVTLNTYSHIIKSQEKKAANKMDVFYNRMEAENNIKIGG